MKCFVSLHFIFILSPQTHFHLLLFITFSLGFWCFDTNETLLATLAVSEDFNLITDSKRCYLDLDLATGSVCTTDRNRNPNEELTLPFGIFEFISIMLNNTPHKTRLLRALNMANNNKKHKKI